MTKRVESTASSPEAARPRFSIDNILQGTACPVPAGLHWVPVTPRAMVQLQPSQHQHKPPHLLPGLQQQQERANSQYLIQFLLNAGLPCPPYRSIMALSSSQQQQPVLVSSSVPCSSSSSSSSSLVPGPIRDCRSSMNGHYSSVTLPPPSLLQQPSQQEGAARHLYPTAATVASQRHEDPKMKLLLPGREKKRKQLPPDLVTVVEEVDASNATGSPRSSRNDSVVSAETSNDSEEEIDREKNGPSTTTDATTASATSSTATDYPCLRRVSSPLLLSSNTPSPAAALTPSASRSTPPQPPPHHHRDMPFKKSRTSFTKAQIQRLEEKFGQQKYLTKLDRTQLASVIGLTEKHVKTWFQNRRTKWKKECSDADWSRHKEMAATLMYNQYLEAKNKNTPSLPKDEISDKVS